MPVFETLRSFTIHDSFMLMHDSVNGDSFNLTFVESLQALPVKHTQPLQRKKNHRSARAFVRHESTALQTIHL